MAIPDQRLGELNCGGNRMSDKIYFTAKDISLMFGISRSAAYQIIKKLNSELEQQGYLVFRGKVSAKYVEDKYYGLSQNS